MDVGGKLLVSLLQEQDTFEFLKYKLFGGLFKGEEKSLFEVVDAHVAKYHTLPSIELVVSKGFDLPMVADPTKYYLDEVHNRFIYDTLNRGFGEASELMAKKDLENSVKRLNQMLDEVVRTKSRLNLTNFGQEGFALWKNDYDKQQLIPDGGIMMGWETLDNMSGGLLGGDVISIVGRPAMGKTWKVLYSALHIWKTQNRPVMVVSMEMSTLPILQRLAAMFSGVNVGHIKQAALTTKELEKLRDGFIAAKGRPVDLWIVDGNLTSTPREIFSLANQLQVGTVLIDGAYLLKSDNPKLDRHQRVAENIEYTKRTATELDMVAICSFQFNREAAKKKKDEKVGLEHIAYSDAIGQVSSIVLGLFEDDGIETVLRRKVDILKGRAGEVGEFYIKWDFQAMDFSEWVKDEGTPLSYL